jgi:hypothetical protein
MAGRCARGAGAQRSQVESLRGQCGRWGEGATSGRCNASFTGGSGPERHACCPRAHLQRRTRLATRAPTEAAWPPRCAARRCRPSPPRAPAAAARTRWGQTCARMCVPDKRTQRTQALATARPVTCACSIKHHMHMPCSAVRGPLAEEPSWLCQALRCKRISPGPHAGSGRRVGPGALCRGAAAAARPSAWPVRVGWPLVRGLVAWAGAAQMGSQRAGGGGLKLDTGEERLGQERGAVGCAACGERYLRTTAGRGPPRHAAT